MRIPDVVAIPLEERIARADADSFSATALKVASIGLSVIGALSAFYVTMLWTPRIAPIVAAILAHPFLLEPLQTYFFDPLSQQEHAASRTAEIARATLELRTQETRSLTDLFEEAGINPTYLERKKLAAPNTYEQTLRTLFAYRSYWLAQEEDPAARIKAAYYHLLLENSAFDKEFAEIGTIVAEEEAIRFERHDGTSLQQTRIETQSLQTLAYFLSH